MDSPTDEPGRRAEVGLCVLFAVADGEVSEGEIAALSTRLGALLGHDFPAIAIGMIVDDEIERMSRIGPDRYIETLVARISESRRKPALWGALRVAAADGLAPEEERMFRDVAPLLGLDAAAIETMLDDVKRGVLSS